MVRLGTTELWAVASIVDSEADTSQGVLTITLLSSSPWITRFLGVTTVTLTYITSQKRRLGNMMRTFSDFCAVKQTPSSGLLGRILGCASRASFLALIQNTLPAFLGAWR